MQRKILHSVEVLAPPKVRLTFADGHTTTLDLTPYMTNPIFDPVKADSALFQTVKVYEEFGDGIYWANGADISAETLFHQNPAKPADRLAALSQARAEMERLLHEKRP